MLDEQMLKNMPPGTIFATGEGIYPNIWEHKIKWLAKRGEGYYDWAIYCGDDTKLLLTIETVGDKIFSEQTIRKLVPCDDTAYGLYRG